MLSRRASKADDLCNRGLRTMGEYSRPRYSESSE